MQAIPFCLPFRAPNELSYLDAALATGVRSGDGPFSARARALLEVATGSPRAFLTGSGTSALELAMLLARVGPGDEVIVPSFTFTSVANAVVLRGAIPVFVDIDAISLNIDPDQVAAAITERTRAIIAVHYAGVVCDMERLSAIARQHGLLLVEDAAHAIGASYRGRPAGSLGDLAAFSFHYTKNISCGEGGCLTVNNPDLLERAEIVFEKGTNRTAFFKGAVDKYSWIDIGGSFTLGELNAAVLVAQLEALEEINARRMAIWQGYADALAPLAEAAGFGLPEIPPDRQHNAHLFRILCKSEDDQTDLIGALRAQGITAPFHYVPLHSAPAGRNYGRAAGPMPVTDSIYRRLVRLPLFPQLGRDAGRVIEAVAAWARRRA